MVKLVDLDKMAKEYPNETVSQQEARIKKHQPRSGSNLDGRTLPVTNEEGQPKYSARKDWQWKAKNAAPGPVTVIKHSTKE